MISLPLSAPWLLFLSFVGSLQKQNIHISTVKDLMYITRPVKILLVTVPMVVGFHELLPSELVLSREKVRAAEEIVSITEQELHSNSPELEQKLLQAARQGFFYVEIPAKLQEQVKEAVDYAHTFYKDEALKSAKLSLTSGYHDFEHAQFETFFCERPHWNIYPGHIQECAQGLVDVSLTILRKVFPLVLPQLPPEHWKQATGGLLDGLGTYFFSFNHYRLAKNMIGLLPHQDTGYITLLYIDKKGLHAHIDNKQWQAIQPKPGYFVVNFGRAFEILVNDSSRLVGAWHFVEKITEESHGGDRISFGLFSDNHPDTAVMAASAEGKLTLKYQSYSAYLKDYLADVKYEKVDIPKIDEAW